MASGDQWPPVASAGRATPKFNGNKRNVKESQQKILSVVNEMFGSALEPDVILSVVQTCNWELQPSIDGLITLTETVDNPLVWNSPEKPETMSSTASATILRKPGLKGGNEEALTSETVLPQSSSIPLESEPPKSDKSKKTVPKNRMGSFCGNIAKLKSSIENPPSNPERTSEKNPPNQASTSLTNIDDLLLDGILNYGAGDLPKISSIPSKPPKTSEFPSTPQEIQPTENPPEKSPPWSRKNPRIPQSSSSPSFSPPMTKDRNRKQETFLHAKAAAEDKEFNQSRKSTTLETKSNPRKSESESLCGLKVQYRVSGMSSSSDDDADVVIEDESSNYKINLTPLMSINVSQFLSPSTQTAPRRTQPELNMISTPSPPQTPQRRAHVVTLNRIKLAIEKGYKIMILIRGLPGSGKSTLAKSIVATTVGGDHKAHVFNTDDFFVNLGRGSYHFDPSRLQEAHSTNHKKVWTAVKESRSPVIVDNTNIEAWEMRPYVAMAVEYGYIVEIIEPDTIWAQNVNQLAKKNIHNVPKTKIRDQSIRYEKIVDAKSLMDRYSLKYSSMNEPPQLRRIPPMETTISKSDATIAVMKSNWSNHGKNNYVLTSHDIETMQNIDERHQGGKDNVNEFADVAPETNETSRDSEKTRKSRDASYDEYLQELQNSDDESFELVENSGTENYPENVGKTNEDEEILDSRRNLAGKNSSPRENDEESSTETKELSPTGSQQILGAIGSERKGSLSICTMGNGDCDKTETKNSSPEGSQQFLGAIGSERKGNSSVEKCLGNSGSDKKEADDTNDSQSPLGAIGSERKESFSVNSNATTSEMKKIENEISEIKENVMAQCWDFTLVSGSRKLHSRHAIEDLPSSSRVRRTKTDEIEKSTDDITIENENDDVKIEKNNKSKDDEIAKLVAALNAEIYDSFESQNGPADIFNDENLLHIDEIKENVVESSIERDEKIKLNDELLIDEPTIIFSEQLMETLNTKIETLSTGETLAIVEKFEISEISDDSVEKIDRSDESIVDEITDVAESTNNSTTAFGTFFKMLKTSILGGTEATTTTDPVVDEIPNESESSINEISAANLRAGYEKTSELKEISTNDIVDSPSVPGRSSNLDPSPEIVAKPITKDDEKSYGDISTNPFRDEMIKSQREKPIENDETSMNDNINSISWKESPFPIDTTMIPIRTTPEIKKIVEKIDASTNTTYYDFNVDYVGGTSEPGYRELTAINRSINDPALIPKPEDPPLKLMLHKSSMTNEVDYLATNENLHLENNEDATDEVKKLVELFPNTPVKTLTGFYEHQCKGNFDWAVEVLLEDVPTDFTIENREIKNSNVDEENFTSVITELTKKCDVKIDKTKQRSVTPSSRNRRQRSKDFRSFSFEYVDDRSSGSGERSVNDDEVLTIKDDEELILRSIYERAFSAGSLPTNNDEISEDSSNSNGFVNPDDDADDLIELDFGREFVGQLEKTFGNGDFTLPDEFKTTIKLKKSMAEELHALWIQSMCDQLNDRQIKLDEMIAKDEEMARDLDRQEIVRSSREIVVPNLDEIMAMEMALASYENELKEKLAREEPNDLASRLTRKMLCESWPDIDPQILSELLTAHDGNFEETCRTIETSTDRGISDSVTLEKQRSLLERVKRESRNRGIYEDVGNVVPEGIARANVDAVDRDEQLSYEDALALVKDARNEEQKQFSLRMENYNKAAAAYGKGHPGIAAYYSQMAKLHLENSKAARAEAADAYVLAQICRDDDADTLDLHSMFVPEALRALETFIDFHSKKLGKSNKRSSTLYIITGRGARSNNGYSKIKPAVSKRLTSKNIRFTDENAGCLRVTLSKKNCILE